MRLLRMVNYEIRHCDHGGPWDEQICDGHWRGAASRCTAHWGRGNAEPTATPRPSPEPCEHPFSLWFGKRNAVVQAQLSHNSKPAEAKNLEFRGQFATCSELRNLLFSYTSRTGFQTAPDGSRGCGTSQFSFSPCRARPECGGRPDSAATPAASSAGSRARREEEKEEEVPSRAGARQCVASLPSSLLPSTPPASGLLPRRRPEHAGKAELGERAVPSRARPAGAAPPRVPVRGCRGTEPPPPMAGPSVCGAARAQGLCPGAQVSQQPQAGTFA